MVIGSTRFLLAEHSPSSTTSRGEVGMGKKQPSTRDGDDDRYPSSGEEDLRETGTEAGVGEGGRGDTTSSGE